MKLGLITTEANAYSTLVALTKDWKDIEVPLSSLQKDAYFLLPRPYPGFLPLKFTSPGNQPLNITDAERIEINFEGVTSTSPISIEVESVYLKK